MYDKTAQAWVTSGYLSLKWHNHLSKTCMHVMLTSIKTQLCICQYFLRTITKTTPNGLLTFWIGRWHYRRYSLIFFSINLSLPYSCMPLDMWIEITMILYSKLKEEVWLGVLNSEKQLYMLIASEWIESMWSANQHNLKMMSKQFKTCRQPLKISFVISLIILRSRQNGNNR